LTAALHYLVLRGEAPELARFFPSAGGGEAPVRAWPVAAATLRERLQDVRGRLRRGVQTNEPGRSAGLYGGLLWISERLGGPLRLSYVWPDEPDRLARLGAALALARREPPAVERGRASAWLRRALAEPRAGLSVVLQSVVWQYLPERERASVTAAIERAGARR